MKLHTQNIIKRRMLVILEIKIIKAINTNTQIRLNDIAGLIVKGKCSLYNA